ncbi:MAG: hypothetical protein EOP54_15625, partial [Sphingobacteriales bacterium]
MRSFFIFYFLLALLFTANGQQGTPGNYQPSATLSYVRTWDAVKPSSDVNAFVVTTPIGDARMTTQYVDGLGRPIQMVVKQGSQAGSAAAVDLVSSEKYDALGRVSIRYLPFASTGSGTLDNGFFKTDAFQQQASFYNSVNSSSPVKGQGETWFYGQTVYEPSPANRVVGTYAAGNNWSGTAGSAEASQHGVRTKYFLNTSLDAVRVFTVSGGYTSLGSYASPGLYNPNELTKTITLNEQGKQSIEFRDSDGKVILKKVQVNATVDANGSGVGHPNFICTYYIYDELNNLRCVVQPEGVKALETNGWVFNSTILAEQCFRYEYDGRKRMVIKKVPGAAEVWMVYDAKDRLVLTQDGNMRKSTEKKWLYTVYDVLNRPYSTGYLTDNSNYTNLSYHLTAGAAAATYPNLGNYPGYVELSTTWFNDYTWRSSVGNPLTATYNTAYNSYFVGIYAASNVPSSSLKGLVTGRRTKILGTSTWLYEVIFYNARGQVIQMQQQNHNGGTDIQTTEYDWSGKPLITISKIQKATTPQAQETIEVTKFTYDDLGRIVKAEKKVSNTLVAGGVMPGSYKIVSELTYNALGNVATKKLGKQPSGSNPLETQTYEYNIRGWLLGMNRSYAKSDAGVVNYFGFDLGYDKLNNGLVGGSTYTLPRYDGNIEGMVWRSKGDGKIRKYDFDYDAVNRLLSANFKQYNGSVFETSTAVNFSVTGLSYDYNGNIQTMNQKGMVAGAATDVDQLTYTYAPGTNRLTQVVDAANANTQTAKLGDFKYASKGTYDYSYDYTTGGTTGNGNLIEDKNKNITSITYDVVINKPSVITFSGNRTITYTYDASGAKLKKVVIETGQPTKTTLYLGNLVYENDQLQGAQHEDGRVRFKLNATSVASLEYDYYLKDHLGNIRMVLTEEQETIYYPAATLEGTFSPSGTQANSMINHEKLFYKIDNSKVVSPISGVPTYANANPAVPNANYPTGHSPTAGVNSTKMYRMKGNENRVGLEFLIKVMAGDRFDIHGKSYYTNTTNVTNANSSALDVATIFGSLLGSPGSAAAGHGVTATQLGNLNPLAVMQPFIRGTNNESTTSVPKAYINYILLDDQFKFVSGNFSRVGGSGSLKDHWSIDQALLNLQNVAVEKNGYLFVYVSNESNFDVYFDNLQVIHKPGPIVEETHYYPFGLTMAGISSSSLTGKAPNKLKYNGIEFNTDFDLNLGDATFRTHDPQIGRWWQIDPKPNYSESPFAAMGNNPIKHFDLPAQNLA